MTLPSLTDSHDEVRDALRQGRPVLALSSTPFAHSLPAPVSPEPANL